MGKLPSSGFGSRLERAGLEVAVIVLGILLALAADAWWDERVRQDRELGLLLALREEFEANAAELEETGRALLQLLDEALLLLEQGQAAWKIRAEREALFKHEQVSVAHDALLSLLEAEIARRR